MISKRQIQELLTTSRCDGVLITHPPIVRWATGFAGSNALVFMDAKGIALVTDARYAGAAEELKGMKALVAHRETLTAVLKRELGSSIQRIGFQADHVSVAAAKRIQSALAPAKLVPLTDTLSRQIASKSKPEIASITKAQQATDATFTEILTVIAPGMTEKAIAAELIYRQLQHGADGIYPDFWPIVASGPNSALPHSQPTDRRIQPGDPVLLDFGCTVNGYCSDMTRTVVCGPPGVKFRTVYDTVLQSHKASLAIAQAGVPASVVDGAYRDFIKQAGYDDVPHAGHGVGLELHEWPRISPHNIEPLPENAVITIEPGIYLPGEFGVRIEDMVVVKKTGCRNLTQSPLELIVL